MGLVECMAVGVGLAMDAFAVSIGKGLSLRVFRLRYAVITGLWFGVFQALMPAAGYLLGTRFADSIGAVDHWIAFALLTAIGLNMLRESRSGEAAEVDGLFTARRMLPLAVATSIDALAVGVTFAFLSVEIVPAVAWIGGITFVIAAAGVRLGTVFGERFATRAELAGGVLLIALGGKILLEHLLEAG